MSLILAFYSLNTLPVNYAGVLLILLGILLFIAEIKITSYGFLTLGGIACLLLGSIMLFKEQGGVRGEGIMVGDAAHHGRDHALFHRGGRAGGQGAGRESPPPGPKG